jgi:hypothetical protein
MCVESEQPVEGVDTTLHSNRTKEEDRFETPVQFILVSTESHFKDSNPMHVRINLSLLSFQIHVIYYPSRASEY